MLNQVKSQKKLQDKPTDEKKVKKHVNNYMKYSGMAIQMGMTILVGVLIGQKLDEYFALQPILTIIFALLSIFAALYLTLKDLV